MTEHVGEHLDPTSEISLEAIKKKAVKGVAVLTGRTLILHLISFVSQGFLWLFITPSEFGVFLMVSAVVNFLSYFADIGLGAAIIQKKEKPKKEDYTTVFLVQETLVVFMVVAVFVLTPFISDFYSLSSEGRNLLYALNISFFLASLKNIPSIILERNLEFAKFAIPQVIENTVYSVSVVYFAYLGMGITSFSYSVLLRGVVGVVVIYLIQPWKPAFMFSKSSFSQLVKFGIPFQLNSFLATVKDDGLTMVLGGVLGSYGLGLLGTAQKLSQYPLRFFMDNVNKVTFPAFSRLQESKVDLGHAITRSAFFVCALVYPSLVGLAVLFPVLIDVIPKYQKWEPSYIPLILLSTASMWAAVTTQVTNFLAAIGKININVKLMIMWTALTWILVPYLSKTWGVNGAGVGYALVSASSIAALLISKRYVNWSVTDSTFLPLVSALVMGALLLALRNLFATHSLFSLGLLVAFGALVYGGMLYLIMGNLIIEDVKKIFRGLSKN